MEADDEADVWTYLGGGAALCGGQSRPAPDQHRLSGARLFESQKDSRKEGVF